MFVTTVSLNVRTQPGLHGAILRTLMLGEQVEVDARPGAAVISDGYVWHPLADGRGYVAERSLDGSRVFLDWQGFPPPPPLPALGTLDADLPVQPSGFTNRQLYEAVHQAAAVMGIPAVAAEWLLRARLQWLLHHEAEEYQGEAIASLPFLSRQAKQEILRQLALLLESAPSPQPDPAPEPSPPPRPKFDTGELPQLPENVDLDPADYHRVRLAALNITRAFEGGSYSSYQNYDRGIVSYGIMQFTLAAGSLGEVMERYFQRSDSLTARTLQIDYGERIAARDENLRQDERLRTLLTEAANEAAMQDAQQAVAELRYWNVVLKNYVQRRGNLVYPLTYALLFDMGIHFGTDHPFVRLAEEALGVPPNSRPGANGITEQQLMQKLAELRRDSHYRQAERDQLPGLKVRGDFWVKLIAAGDWYLQGDSEGFVEVKPGVRVQVRKPTY